MPLFRTETALCCVGGWKPATGQGGRDMDDMKKVVLYAKVSRLICDIYLLSIEYGEDADDIGLKELSKAADELQAKVGAIVNKMREVN